MQDPESFQEYRADQVATLEAGHSVGQTFVSRRPGLNQVQLWLQADKNGLPPGAKLTVDLFYQPGEKKPLASLTYQLSSLTESNQLTIPFTARPDAPDQGYYLRLTNSGGRVIFFGRSENAQTDGQMFFDEQPQEADLSFRLSYAYGWGSVLTDISAWITQAWLAIPLLFLLVLPGRLALRLSGFDSRLDWGERTALSIGLSVSLAPLAMLWTSTLGFSWTRPAVLILSLGLLGIYLWLLIRPNHNAGENWRSIYRAFLPGQLSYTQGILALVILFALAVRMVMVRDLAAPAWVDSVHHAMLSRLIIDQGAFPTSYQPYLNIASASYHPGFHSLVAFFVWLSGQELSQAMLLLGQVLNALTLFGVYLLAVNLSGSRLAGVFASLLAGLASPMPAYYTSWGRYTQLTGLLVLPVAFILLKMLLDLPPAAPLQRSSENRQAVKLFVLASISLAGLFLVHYRVLAFLVCLIFAYLIIQLVIAAWRRRFWRSLAWYLSVLLAAAIASIFLTASWWPPTLRSLFIPVLSMPVPGLATPAKAFADFSWSYLNTALGLYVLGLAGLGFIWSLLRRQTFGLVLVLWVVLLFLLANLRIFSIPGSVMLNNTSVAIMLFIPASVLGGYLIGWLVDGWIQFVPQRWRPVYFVSWAGLTVVFMLVAARILLPILNPVTFLFRAADHSAMAWIEQNIPVGETIAINPFHWGYGLYAGSDGGHWITPLARRRSFPPPILYGMDYSSGTVGAQSEGYRQLLDLASKPVELHPFLLSQGIRYIYIGARGGAFSPQALQSHPDLFDLLYTLDDAYVFGLRPQS